jgi:tetratricopeptide (TPR) repeat protein
MVAGLAVGKDWLVRIGVAFSGIDAIVALVAFIGVRRGFDDAEERRELARRMFEASRSESAAPSIPGMTPISLAYEPDHELVTYRSSEQERVRFDELLVEIRDTPGPLVLVGAPGSGKTLTLRRLVESLLDEARDAPSAVAERFVLSRWREGTPLEDWLATEWAGRREYGLSRSVARGLVTDPATVIALDGLDEVTEPRRDACVVAINNFLERHPAARAVIACREEEYRRIDTRVDTTRVRQIARLDREEIASFVGRYGPSSWQYLRARLDVDEVLVGLLGTPLHLIAALTAFRDPTPLLLGTRDERERVLWAHYVDDRLRRLGASKDSLETHRRWLGDIAITSVASGLDEFFPHDLGTSWTNRMSKVLVATSVAAGWAIVRGGMRWRGFVVVAIVAFFVTQSRWSGGTTRDGIDRWIAGNRFRRVLCQLGTAAQTVPFVCLVPVGLWLMGRNDSPRLSSFDISYMTAMAACVVVGPVLHSAIAPSMLVWTRRVPPNLHTFLEECVSSHLLRRRGIGYRVLHRQLQAHLVLISLPPRRRGSLRRRLLYAPNRERSGWYNLSLEAEAAGHYDPAAQMAKMSCSLRPWRARYWMQLGDCLFHLARYDEALHAYDRCMGLRRLRDRVLGSIARLERVSRFKGLLRTVESSIIHNNRGVVLLVLDRHDDAVRSLRRAVTMRSDDALEALVLLGALEWSESPQDARTKFDRALTHEGKYLSAFRRAELRSIALAGKGQPEQAVAELTSALKLVEYTDEYQVALYDRFKCRPLPGIDRIESVVEHAVRSHGGRVHDRL